MKKTLIAIIILILITLGLKFFIFNDKNIDVIPDDTALTDDTTPDDTVTTDNTTADDLSKLFMDKVIVLGVETVGRPIEGFNAFILKQAFPGLMNQDFEGVKTLEGHYELVDGALEYKRDLGNPITSAEQMVSEEGYSSLLSNLSTRLGILIVDEPSVEDIINILVVTKPDDTEPIAVLCAPEQRDVAACIAIYQPVCGKVNVECVTTPCDPVFETFSNSCFACMNSLVESYVDGECANLDLKG